MSFSRELKIAFVMDPLEGIDVFRDTTYVMMQEARRRGHAIYHLPPEDVFVENGRVMGRTSLVTFHEGDVWFCCAEPEETELKGMDVIFMREDPPFDMDYLYSTLLMSLIEKEVFIVNSPQGIRNANEKLYTLNFPEIMPEHVVTNDMRRLKRFMESVGGRMVVKPLDSCGGRGVFALFAEDRNTNAVLEMMTEHGRKQILAQKYIPEVRDGDKRLIILNGEPIGAVNRVPLDTEHRANIHVGASCAKAPVTERDREITRIISEKFKEDGIYFAGLDIIGGFVTEINVTSPTGVQEINRLDGVKLEEPIIDFIEEAAGQYLSLR